MTSDQTFQLVSGFISALISGAVTGLIVGLILLRSQFGRQLALDDETKLIDILHSLEGISDKIAKALAWQQVGKELDLTNFDEADARDKVRLAQLEVSVVELPRLLPRLEYIRSKRYGRIKQYLVSGIKSGRLESDDPGQFVKNIRDFLADIQYFIYHHYGLVNHVRSIWQMMVMIFKGNAITLEEKSSWPKPQEI